MAAIARKHQKIFGSALAALNNISQFGSLKAGSPAYSLDPETIQALSAWANAWSGAVVAVGGVPNVPPIQDVNAVEYVCTYQLAYLLERGVPEWDDATEYNQWDVCRKNGVLYFSLTNTNTNNDPASSATNWISWESPAGAETAGQSLDVDGTPYKITFTELFDPDACFASSTYTAKLAGYYRVSAFVQVDNDDAHVSTMELSISIVKNGSVTVLASGENTPNPNGHRWYPKVMGLVQLAANDTLEVFVTGSDNTLTGAVDISNGNFSVERVRTT